MGLFAAVFGWAVLVFCYQLYVGLLYTLLTRFIPMVSPWEYKQGAIMEGVETVGGGRMLVAVREEEIG